MIEQITELVQSPFSFLITSLFVNTYLWRDNKRKDEVINTKNREIIDLLKEKKDV